MPECCLWEAGLEVVFHASEVSQTRNAHSLLSDFKAEVPGYLGNANLADTLERVHLRPGVNNIGDNVISCYEALVGDGFFPSEEMPLLRAWHSDLCGLTALNRDAIVQ